ncbi:MAG: mannose-6-phosphate isomerase-like protein (cupin superfamily) [Verrucomicrobiales bacterium]|jgi:mannose-6-phosphate isomerase-like protein (cupin superfamily)
MSSEADVVVPSDDLSADIALLEANGFRLTTIFPADEPRVAQLRGHGLGLRLDVSATTGAPALRVPGVAATVDLSAGASLVTARSGFDVDPLDDAYVYTSGGEWGAGRAGMQYRDLIPDRHGGRVIASHIRIEEPGPVPDYVHHHNIRFQMIYCRRGAVQVVYEGQGEPFWMVEGDCVLQPPHIRHRVLESADGCEVVEIASPAEHPTFIEHEMSLPTPEVEPDRDFGGQKFCFDRGQDLPWKPLHEGWEQQVFSVAAAMNDVASVRIVRPGKDDDSQISGSHHGDLCLFFVLAGGARLEVGADQQLVGVDDSVAIPTKTPWRLSEASVDFLALHVMLQADTS